MLSLPDLVTPDAIMARSCRWLCAHNDDMFEMFGFSADEFKAKERMALPPDSVMVLPRSTSVKAASTASPLTVNTSRQPSRGSSSTPTTPVFARQKLRSINCMAATSTDTPPATPKDKQPKSESSYASMWSPRKLMQRASRAFCGSGRSSRRKKRKGAAAAAAAVGDVTTTDSPRSVASKGSNIASVESLEEQIANVVVHDEGDKQEEHHVEVVPEKIIHEANPPVVNQLPAVAEDQVEECTVTPEKEAPAAAAAPATPDADVVKEKEEEEEPKKGAAPAPEDAAAEEVEEEPKKVAALPAPEDVAGATDKITAAKEEATKKREEAIIAEVVRRFQGSRVKTAMERRSDEGQTPRRRETAGSNDVIEEARNKLLELRQGSRVKALVGAFETVMDENHRHAAAGKPQLNLRP